MPQNLYLDCFSGISGDMLLGALIDLGVPTEIIQKSLDALRLNEPLHLHTSRQTRGLVSGIKVDVHFHEHTHSHNHSHTHNGDHEHHSAAHHGRSYTSICQLIDQSTLDPWIKKHAASIFHRIGIVEAHIHNKTIEEIHFHEVGGLDSIADIVGCCSALHHLKLDRILSSPLIEGTGSIHCAHGTFPLPAPATLALLSGTGAPLKQIDLPYELITPTGAALLAEFAQSFALLDHVTIDKIGWGLGTRELPNRPNALRALLVQATLPDSSFESDTVCVLETNIDDSTAEILGYLSELLLEKGAYDVAYLPATMKKSRPGWQLQVIAPTTLRDALTEIILCHSSAFGLRISETVRLKLSRETVQVSTPYGNVSLKLGKRQSEILKMAPEYEDCKRLAHEHQVPLQTIYNAALQAFQDSDFKFKPQRKN